jgi:hypothetical protein
VLEGAVGPRIRSGGVTPTTPTAPRPRVIVAANITALRTMRFSSQRRPRPGRGPDCRIHGLSRDTCKSRNQIERSACHHLEDTWDLLPAGPTCVYWGGGTSQLRDRAERSRSLIDLGGDIQGSLESPLQRRRRFL